jgi:release factor glutamine methyltransferase
MDSYSPESNMRIIKRWGVEICWNKMVYDPSDDTFLLLEYINENKREFYGRRILELGTGTGIVGLYMLLSGARDVVMTDINPYSLEAAKCTLSIHKKSIGDLNSFSYTIIGCDMLECFRKKSLFNVIVFNPPYLPTPCKDSLLELSWCNGFAVISRFLEYLNSYLTGEGKVLLVVSDKLPVGHILSRLSGSGFKVDLVAERKLFFEKLLLVKAVKTIGM